MNKIAQTIAVLFAVCSAASPLQAAEGILLAEKTVTGSRTRTSQIQIEHDRMRAEMTGPSGDVQVVVFDGPQQVLRIISVDRKAYSEMTKEDADRMGAQVAATMAAMKDKIASLPPEQRAKVEALMSRVGGTAPAGSPGGRPEYRRAGTDKVGKWACDKYEGFRSGEKVAEVCTVDAKTLGLTEADFEVTKQVGAFFEKMLPQGIDQIVGVGKIEVQGFAGIPIRRTAYNGGKVTSVSEVTDVRRESFAASSYDPPAGFQKQPLVRGGPGRQGAP